MSFIIGTKYEAKMWLSITHLSCKKSLKLYLNLPWFKLYTISPKTPAIYFSRYLQSMKRQLQTTIWKRVIEPHLGLSTRLKTSFLNFPFSCFVFVISFNNNIITFSLLCLSCDFHQNNGKKQGTDIFSTWNPPVWHYCYLIKLTCLSHLFQ